MVSRFAEEREPSVDSQRDLIAWDVETLSVVEESSCQGDERVGVITSEVVTLSVVAEDGAATSP